LQFSCSVYLLTADSQAKILKGGNIRMNMSLENCPNFLTVSDLSSVLRIGRNAAYQLVKDGSLPSIRIGRSIRIPRSALVQFVERTQQPA